MYPLDGKDSKVLADLFLNLQAFFAVRKATCVLTTNHAEDCISFT